MSSRQNRRERFLREHPFCCYCGGGAPAVEVDHNPPRAWFSDGATPKGFRFPCCASCNDAKKDAESRSALVATAFSRADPQGDPELARAIKRGLAFIDRDPDVLAAFVEHPTLIWDFARAAEPGAVFDPMSVLDIPHALPESFGRDLFNLGRFFGQAMYYRAAQRPMRAEQVVGVTLFTNAISAETREALDPILSALEWQTPAPALRRREGEFHFGVRWLQDADTLFFAGERHAAFMWFGLAGASELRTSKLRDYHWWRGDGSCLALSEEA